MRRALLVSFLSLGLFVGFHAVGPGGTPAVAATPVPGCLFAGFDPAGSIVNTQLPCSGSSFTTVIDVTQAPYNAVCDGTTDDATAIQAAITAVNVQVPTEVLIPKICAVGTTLQVSSDNTYVDGYGSGYYNTSGNTVLNPRSALKWIGSLGGTVLQFDTGTSAPINRGGVNELAILSNNGKAAVGLEIKSGMKGGRFDDDSFDNFTNSSQWLHGLNGSGAGRISQNFFDNGFCVNFLHDGNTGTCMTIGDKTANTASSNNINGLRGLFCDSSGALSFEQTDANQLKNIQFTQCSTSTTGISILYDCGSRSNVTYWAVPGQNPTGDQTLVARGDTTCGGTGVADSINNTIVNEDAIDDGIRPPIIEPGASLFITDETNSIVASGLATSGTTYYPPTFGTAYQASVWNGSAAVKKGWTIGLGSGAPNLNFTSNPGGKVIFFNDASMSANFGAFQLVSSAGAQLTNLTASSCVGTDASKNLTSVPCPTGTTLATSGSSSVATGAVANTFQTLPCGTGSVGCSAGVLSVTAPATSTGINNAHVVTLTYQLSDGGVPFASEAADGCVSSASTFTQVDGGNAFGANPCRTALTNRFMGVPGFGDTVAANATASSSALWTSRVTIANGATFAATPWVEGGTATSVTVYGTLSLRVDDY